MNESFDEKTIRRRKRYNKNNNSNIILRSVSAFFIVLLITLCVVAFTSYLHVENNCKGYYDRTIESADAKQMSFYLDKTITGMETLKITDVYSDPIMRIPSNDLSIDYNIFKELKNRLNEVMKFPIGSMDYAKSLDDIRIQIKSQTFDPYGGYMLNSIPVVWWLLLNWVAMALWALVGMVSVVCFVASFVGDDE